MAKLGADVVGLDAVAADLDRFAATVERAQATVDAQLRRTAWNGPDADAFRASWRRIRVVDLDGVRAELTAAAQHVRRQADDQRRASGDRPTLGSNLAFAGVSGRMLAGGMIGAGMLQPAAGSGALGPGGRGVPLGPPRGNTGPPRRDPYVYTSIGNRSSSNFGSVLTALSSLGELDALPPGILSGGTTIGVAGALLTAGNVGINAGFARYHQELNAGRTSSDAQARAVGSAMYQGGTAAAASKGGAVAGAKAGAVTGAKLGLFFGPKGVAVGAVAGGVVGAVGGSKIASVGLSAVQETALGQGLDDAAAWTGGALADAATSKIGLITDVGGSVRDLGSGLTNTIGGLFR